MADHIAIQNYKKSVEKITKKWEGEIAKGAAELKKIDAELAPHLVGPRKAKISGILSKDDVASLAKSTDKKVKALLARRAKAQKTVDAATKNLEINLKMIQIPADAPEKELIKLPDWVKEIIRRKGIPLGKTIGIRPDISIDAKKKKIKSVGVVITW